MPELPEVEVVRRNLETTLLTTQTAVITKINLLRKDLREVMPRKKIEQTVGGTVLGIERRAKYLIFKTSKGDLLSHLGMTGQWRVQDHRPRTHDHIVMSFSNGIELVYSDPRRFGLFCLLDAETQQKKIQALGPEPLDLKLDQAKLFAKIKSRTASIKSVIMDQKIIVGVGNIYASEALFLSGIKPTRSAKRVTAAEFTNLLHNIRQVLGQAIIAGGSSISDFANALGEKGGYQQSHLVYDRAGMPCLKCKTKISLVVVAGRSSFWCRGCQR